MTPVSRNFFVISGVGIPALPPIQVHLMALTALATLSENGTVKGLEAGANVIMPNISPTNIRNLYTLYNNKKITGGESLEGINNLKGMLKQYGYEVIVGRGDSLI